MTTPCEYNIDPNRIALMGASAGGHLVQLLGYTANGPDSKHPKIKAVVSLYGWSDLTDPDVNYQYYMQFFLGKSYADAPKLYKEASPITHVDKNSPATLIMGGTIDTIVPIPPGREAGEEAGREQRALHFCAVPGRLPRFRRVQEHQSRRDVSDPAFSGRISGQISKFESASSRNETDRPTTTKINFIAAIVAGLLLLSIITTRAGTVDHYNGGILDIGDYAVPDPAHYGDGELRG